MTAARRHKRELNTPEATASETTMRPKDIIKSPIIKTRDIQILKAVTVRITDAPVPKGKDRAALIKGALIKAVLTKNVPRKNPKHFL